MKILELIIDTYIKFGTPISSKTISNLQQKARDTRYKERLDKMESKTMSMLVSTGLGVMIFLVFAVMQMMGT